MNYIIFTLLLSLPVFSQELPENFEFGVSSASAQVEDDLNDSWMEFAHEGKTKAFLNYPHPDRKIEFWSKSEIEIQAASELGVKVFRLSIDWQRLVPIKNKNITNKEALLHYKNILKSIQDHKMKVMLTLYHHSLPKWAIEMGGWGNRELKDYFLGFAKDAYNELAMHVDYWNTFNEPNVYALFTYVAGNWPPGKGSFFNALNLPFYKGDFFKALDHMAQGHIEFYEYAHKKNNKVQISIAQNTANYKTFGFFSSFAKNWSWANMNFYFPDLVKNHLDFMGINYYGSEYLTIDGVGFSSETEYNDAGRAFDPNGLYLMLETFYNRYRLPIYITENGTADKEDLFKSLYIGEHIAVIQKSIQNKIPVLGYIYWTLTDNFEWSDGYCPEFGLVKVNRENFKRKKQESYYFYQELIQKRGIDQAKRDKLWLKYSERMGKERSMCRDENGRDGLDRPRKILLKSADWRFKY